MRSLLSIFLLFLLSTGSPASAQDREVPYWASIRATKVNMRVGPSEDYPIKWVYQRKGLPVKVVRLMEGWRLVQDPDGAQGWIVSRLLDPQQTAIIIGNGLAELRQEPSGDSALLWKAEPGVVGKLDDCVDGWCLFDTQGRKGWVRQDRLWGAGEP